MGSVVRILKKTDCEPLGSGNRFNDYPIEVYKYEDKIFITVVSIKEATGHDIGQRVRETPGFRYKLNNKLLLVQKSTLYSWRFPNTDRYQIMRDFQEWVSSEQYLLPDERAPKSVNREALKLVKEPEPDFVVEKVSVDVPDSMEEALEDIGIQDDKVKELSSLLRKELAVLRKMHLALADQFIKTKTHTTRTLSWYAIRDFIPIWGVSKEARGHKDYNNYVRSLGSRAANASRKEGVKLSFKEVPKGVGTTYENKGGYNKKEGMYTVNTYREDILEELFLIEFGPKRQEKLKAVK